MTRVLLFNKPYGVLSQFTDKGTGDSPRPTLSGFIDVKGVYPAGRLDRDSEGLLVLTDNGRLQARIASPRYKQPETYLVQVEGDPSDVQLEQLRRGVRLASEKGIDGALLAQHVLHDQENQILLRFHEPR